MQAKPEEESTFLASTVIGMGLKPAVGITQHLHRNVLDFGARLGRELPDVLTREEVNGLLDALASARGGAAPYG